MLRRYGFVMSSHPIEPGCLLVIPRRMFERLNFTAGMYGEGNDVLNYGI